MQFIRSSDWKYGTGSRGLNSYGDGGNDLITVTTTLTAASGKPVTRLVDGRKEWQTGGTTPEFDVTDTDATGKYIQFDFAEAVEIHSALLWSDKTGYGFGTWKWQGSNDNWATSDDITSEFTLAPSPPAAFTQARQLMPFTTVAAYSSLRLLGVTGTMTPGIFGTEMQFLTNIGQLTCGDFMVSNVRIAPVSNIPLDDGTSPGISSTFAGVYDHDPDNPYTGCRVDGDTISSANYIGIDNKTILNYKIKVLGLRLFTRDVSQSLDYGKWQAQYKDSGGSWVNSGSPMSWPLPAGKSDYRVRESFTGATTDESAEWQFVYAGPESAPPVGAVPYLAFHLLYEEGSDAPVVTDLDLAATFTDEAAFVAELPVETKPPTQLCVVVTGGFN